MLSISRTALEDFSLDVVSSRARLPSAQLSISGRAKTRVTLLRWPVVRRLITVIAGYALTSEWKAFVSTISTYDSKWYALLTSSRSFLP